MINKIVIPGTIIRSSRLGFGTSMLHHSLTSRGRQNMLACAFDEGISHFDTAPMYGEGLAERDLGRFICGRREHLTIATKIGLPANRAFEKVPSLFYLNFALGYVGRRLFRNIWSKRPKSFSVKSAEDSLERSLRALRTDWLNILFLHEPRQSDIIDIEFLIEWLRKQKEVGRVQCIGLAGDARECCMIDSAFSGVFDILQVEDSVFGRDADMIVNHGRPLQITYGYFRLARQSGDVCTTEILSSAFERNKEGVILVSTRRIERLKALCQMEKCHKIIND